MESKRRIPPYLRRQSPGPGMSHPELFRPVARPPVGALPHDVMPPEIIEQKLSTQHIEMQTLATENQRLAASHSVLRHELAAAQHELKRLQSHMYAGKFEHEQQMMAMLDKFSKMEADLRASKPLKVELQQAQAEAQSLVAARQELKSEVHELIHDLQKIHEDAHQIPSLISELDDLRQEYQHCRDTYDYERKLRIDHYESLQVMENNYVSMLEEVEKLQRKLVNASHVDKTCGSYGSNVGYKENDASGEHSLGQNAYEDGYRAPQKESKISANRMIKVESSNGTFISLPHSMFMAVGSIKFETVDFQTKITLSSRTLDEAQALYPPQKRETRKHRAAITKEKEQPIPLSQPITKEKEQPIPLTQPVLKKRSVEQKVELPAARKSVFERLSVSQPIQRNSVQPIGKSTLVNIPSVQFIPGIYDVEASASSTKLGRSARRNRCRQLYKKKAIEASIMSGSQFPPL